MEKLTTELHSLSEMDRRHVVSILAEIANGYDDFNDMLIYLEFYPNHKILIENPVRRSEKEIIKY